MTQAGPTAQVALRVLPSGSTHVLIELPDLDATIALLADLQARPVPGVVELVAGARTLSLSFDRFATDVDRIAGDLSRRRLSALQTGRQRTVEIPVRYDGEDLDEVARLTGLTTDDVITRHTQSLWTVAFGGFAPGFAYLSGGDPALEVPRRTSPRTRIPPGSVALAGHFSGVYPQASPGGWQIIGTTPAAMWDLARTPPALLAPGDRVQFINRPDAKPAPKATPDRATDAQPTGFTVVQALLPAYLQDAGRTGMAAQGVSASGAMDMGALYALNRILGNPPDCAALEVAGGQFVFETDRSAVIALTGAPCEIRINDRLSFMSHRAVALDAGDRVKIGPPETGLRSYLGVRGGFDVDPVLGSRSTDTLAGLGPAAVTQGTVLPLAQARASATGDPELAASLPRTGDTVEIDIIMGPRTDWFTPAQVQTFCGQDWAVTAQSSRVGIRLDGEQPLLRSDARELPSEGTLRGSIQIPHSGQPVLFLADHPLTGGYPVIAVVARHHLDLAGQIPPGAKIRFRPVAPFAEIAAFKIARQP